jgi:ketosteroid isomerase-like protein
MERNFQLRAGILRRMFTWNAGLLLILVLGCAPLASAQKNKKQQTPSADNTPPIQLPTAGQLDDNIGEMLGAWQVDDVDAMHKYYSDDATFTSGAYEVPIIGWKNYLEAYQKQRARIQAMSLIRRNTNIFFRTDFAWATYQWELSGVVDNQSMSAKGQTTLVFALTNGRWLIVHNHTSEICGSTVTGPLKSDQQAPTIGDQKAPTPK